MALLALLVYWLFGDGLPPPELGPGGSGGTNGTATAAAGEQSGVEAATAGSSEAQRTVAALGERASGVRGIVLDAATAQPLAGIEVLAVKQQPSFEPLMNRFRGLIQGGLFTDTQRPAQVLGRTISNADGTFELTGLGTGLVYLDGRSDGYYVRTPASARLANGQMIEGIELRAQPGGRVRGIVLGADGGPVPGAAVSLRPGLNAFLGQLTDRKYRWLQTVTDADGRFDIPGVPTGEGYVVSSSAKTMALEELHGIGVLAGQVTEVTLRGHEGATVAGRVFGPDGVPIAGANVAMVYLDISRVLFSADGRSEPITTDADGKFSVRPVAAGRVAFVAAAEGLAPSAIEDLAVVDGGIYPDLELRLGDGVTVTGKVVDDQKQPVAGAAVELRPWERPDDPQFLKMMLKIRRVDVTTDQNGVFVARGMTGERLVVQASKKGYTTATRMGVKIDDKNLEVQIQRGAVVRGRVVDQNGQPVARYRVDTRSREPKPEDGKDGAAVTDASRSTREGNDGMSGASWEGGGRGRRGEMRETTIQLPEGQTLTDRGMNVDGAFTEIAADDGRFELTGIPPGDVRVRVRAEGYLEPENQEITLTAGQVGDELTFTLAAGLAASGTVVDAATGKPVSDAQVTAYKQKERKDRSMFAVDIDPEDMDFLGMSVTHGKLSALTDSQGRFTIPALSNGTYRFTARHPDMAKSSAKDVVITADAPVLPIEITIDAGGAIEGNVTGMRQRPMADAVVAAFSMQSGTLRSATTDQRGFYTIDGLPPGQYAVFKSRLDERADNIPLELLSNMRLKTVSVQKGKRVRLDIADESEDGVRVHGVVRENGAPVPRALVTLLGADRDGILGMGVRANAAGHDGRYEVVGIKPGSYVVQVSRFQGRPVQTSMTVEVPEEQLDFLLDLDLPSSEVRGRVLDSRGNPVAGMQVSLGSDQDSLGSSEGLIGMIAQGGLSQGRTDDNGDFVMQSVSAGTYRLRASNQRGRGRGRRGGDSGETKKVAHGEAELEGIVVDGSTNVEGLVVTVPIAGRITGIVLDGSGAPVRGAEIHYAETSRRKQRGEGGMLASLFGMQVAPIMTGDDGRFDIEALTPGVYDLRVDTEALEAGRLQDVTVGEDGVADVQLRIVRGAKLRVRATNVDKSQIPLAQLSLYDSSGKAVVNRISTLSVMRRLMASKDSVENSGWYEFGSVPPDSYTIVVAEPGKPEIRITRAVADGETIEWDVDVAQELAAREQQGK
ncbi:MAG: carboxypeptidase-like regulatory domain-containing protein [Planctomycetota bacterium]